MSSSPTHDSPSSESPAAMWDERYASSSLVWSAEPNALAASLLRDLAPGRALDVAAGEGRMALWLADLGWQVTALDFSSVGLAKGRSRAEELGLQVDWKLADATAETLGVAAYDLVMVLYLHLPEPELRDLLDRCATALAPGGHLLVLGHDKDNLLRGVGGPQDARLLYDTTLLAPPGDLQVLRLEQVERPAAGGVAVDTLLLATRPQLAPE
ncbi:MAG: class I SAM-dependent methyltransferase [Actinomycetota bacterium]|nr:class I SAM-dependent methyltransferase [Actinomycetota bacterium]